jgi:hypothetical protein
VTTTTPGIQLRPGGQRGWPPAAAGRSGTVACLVYRAGRRAAVRGRLLLTGGVRITQPIEDSTARLAARTTSVSIGSPVLERLLAGAGFLDTGAFPQISFRSGRLAWVPAGGPPLAACRSRTPGRNWPASSMWTFPARGQAARRASSSPAAGSSTRGG